MISQNIQIKLTGLWLIAFTAFCERKGLTSSRAGIIAMISELPEYRRLAGIDANKIQDEQSSSEDAVI